MKEEIRKILDMLEQGTVTAEQAAQLIEAIESATGDPIESATSPGRKTRRKLRIVVTSDKGDNVNIKIPARLVTAGVKISRYFAKTTDDSSGIMKELDWDELTTAIQQMIDDNQEGEIVDVMTEKGEHVKIWLD